MNWTKLSSFATVMAAVLIATSATTVVADPPADADCGDAGQPPCAGAISHRR
jgi:hypothetical protein